MQNNTDSRVYAGFFVRLSAYLIDWLIVSAALLIIRIPVWIANLGGCADLILKDFIFEYSIYDIVLYLLKVAYFVLMTYFTGFTLGKKLLQIQVVSTEGRKPTFFEIVFRESVGKFLSALILYVGYFMIGADKQKRGLHDILSDTYVVYSHQRTIAVPTPVTYHTVSYSVQRPTVSYQTGTDKDGSIVPHQTGTDKNEPLVSPNQQMSSQNEPLLKQGEVIQPVSQNASLINQGEAEPLFNRTEALEKDITKDSVKNVN